MPQKAGRFIALLVLLMFAASAQSELEADGTLSLKAGLNLVSFPNEFSPPMTSRGLGALFGESLIAVSRISTASAIVETTTFIAGVPAGADFPVVAGEGYYLDLVVAVSLVLDGAFQDIAVDLQPGVNLVGFNPVRRGFTAYQLLKFIGPGTAVTSVRRFDANSGRYQSAIQSADTRYGENFNIVPGEAYLISMLQPVEDVVVPGALFVTRASENFLMLREVMSSGGGHSTDGTLVLQSVTAQSTPLGEMSDGSLVLSGGYLVHLAEQ